jgi:serine/threonine protein kinase
LYNTFVLKSYHHDAAEQHEREVKSFVHLRVLLGPSAPNFIGFYGSYTHGRTSNVILEYANEGTLEDYFKRVPPPSTGPEIYLFWSRLLALLRALDALHNLPYGNINHIG